MTVTIPEDWKRDIESRSRIRRTDIQRLWKRIPIVPQDYAGSAGSAPGVDLPNTTTTTTVSTTTTTSTTTTSTTTTTSPGVCPCSTIAQFTFTVVETTYTLSFGIVNEDHCLWCDGEFCFFGGGSNAIMWLYFDGSARLETISCLDGFGPTRTVYTAAVFNCSGSTEFTTESTTSNCPSSIIVTRV